MPPLAPLATFATSTVMLNEPNSLTELEIQVINLIAQGHKDEEIESRLEISSVEMERIMTSIYAKLGVSDRLELIIYALYHGIAVLPH